MHQRQRLRLQQNQPTLPTPAGEQPQRSGGTPLAPDVRSQMEGAFGHQFSAVRVHADGPADRLNRTLNADAVTVGSNIFFRTERFRPQSPAGRHLLAHELAHVVQQGSGPAPPQASAANVSHPADLAERQASRAADAVARGERAPQLPAAPAGFFYRAVKTNGGEWDTSTYSNHGTAAAVGDAFGAQIALTFKPNELVEADNIGLTQSVRALKSTAVGGAVDTPSYVGARKQSISLTAAEGEAGRAIDQGDPGDADTLPNTNPMYNVENKPGSVSATLSDVGADASFGQHGFRKKKVDGTYDVQDATLSDRPTRTLEFVGQQYDQQFEATALVLDGPLANTYLGTVGWGWSLDAAGTLALRPNPISVIRNGAPTAQFMAAATKWNASTFTDPTDGTTYNTVDLPTTRLESGAKPVTEMTTKELLTSMGQVNLQLIVLALVSATDATAAANAANDITNKNFEKKALEAELAKRKAMVKVKVNSTEDWLGSDNVYVKMRGPGGAVEKTAVKYLNDGESFDFLIPLEKLVPLNGPYKIQVFDEDTPDADDLIVEMEWQSPFDDLKNTESYDDANYDVLVMFER